MKRMLWLLSFAVLCFIISFFAFVIIPEYLWIKEDQRNAPVLFARGVFFQLCCEKLNGTLRDDVENILKHNEAGFTKIIESHNYIIYGIHKATHALSYEMFFAIEYRDNKIDKIYCFFADFNQKKFFHAKSLGPENKISPAINVKQQIWNSPDRERLLAQEILNLINLDRTQYHDITVE